MTPPDPASVHPADDTAELRSLAARQRPSLDGAALWLLLHMLSGLRVGRVDVRLPDGRLRSFGGSSSGPHGQLLIRRARVVGRVIAGGSVGFADAYLDGDWDSPDLTALLWVLHLNEPYFKGPFEKNLLGRRVGQLLHRLRDNGRWMARRNIGHHYDLGNDFYRLWLDPSLTYSSAVFAHSGQSLAEAQQHKLDLMLQRLSLRDGDALLEIGSGWGAFAIHAAQRVDCRVHSITLSRAQLDEARARAQAAGVADRVHFELRDYRDIERRYDAVVSIEMLEAVGERWWPHYFATVHRALKPGGRAAIQGITIDARLFDDYRRGRDFIQKYIFPGGMLAPPQRWLALARAAGLQPDDVRFHGGDYARTLACWRDNVDAQASAITERFDARFLRMWRYYLAYCEAGFRAGSTELMQVSMRRSE